jgi:DNA processing protein
MNLTYDGGSVPSGEADRTVCRTVRHAVAPTGGPDREITSPASDRRPSSPGEVDRTARLVLHHAAEAGDSLIARLVAAFGAPTTADALASGTGPDLLPADSEDEECRAMRAALIKRTAALRTRCARADLEGDLVLAKAAGAHYCIPGDRDWPVQLVDLGDAVPLGLWLKGTADLALTTGRCVSIVGARNATDYGMHVAAELAIGLAETGWVVVSGAAKGIDGAAHRGALAGRGLTAAVLACGIDQIYPLGHSALLSAVADEGLIVSELPPGTMVTRFRFLDRNRLIAALSRGTVVVEAAARSGSLVTARLADEIGRPVLAVPGPVTSELSQGTHQLLRDGGAVLVTRSAEVAEHLGDLGEDLAPPLPRRTRPRDALDPIATRVLEALPLEGRAVADVAEVAAEAGVEPRDALAALGRLAAGDWVDRDGGGWFARRRP